jgi:hypothetical protein
MFTPRRDPLRCTFFCVKPAFWVLYLTIPLEFLMQTLVLTRPVCAALTSTPFGRDATRAIAASLDAATAAALHAAPACPARGGGSGGGGGGAPAAAACAGVMVVWQALMCCALLYANYRLARAARVKFALEGGWGGVHNPWPPAPQLVRVVVHVIVFLQAGAALWAWLGCAPLVIAAAPGPAPLAPAAAAPAAAAVAGLPGE